MYEGDDHAACIAYNSYPICVPVEEEKGSGHWLSSEVMMESSLISGDS